MSPVKRFFLISLLLSAPAVGADVAELEAACEAAREAKLKPIRDGLIADCKQDKRNDPGWCERFYSDYGEAGRTASGAIRPRMFDDLPECVAAMEARKTTSRQ